MQSREKALAGLVRRHPLSAFVVGFFALGWPIAFAPVVAESSWGIELPFQPFAIATTLVGLLAALAVTRLVDGQQGVRVLVRRTLTLRASLGWYAFTLLAVPLGAVALAVILFGAPEASTSTLVSAVAGGLLLQGLITFVTINLWEEVTWMGFFQARLQPRHGPLLAAVITAAFFTLQHLPLFFANGTSVVVVLPAFFAMSIGFRALMAWVYNRTLSLFLVGLLHAAGNGAGGGSGFGDGLLPRLYANPNVRVVHTLAAFLIGLALIAVTRGRLGAPARPAPLPQTAEERSDVAGERLGLF